jgi:hypothetical protein
MKYFCLRTWLRILWVLVLFGAIMAATNTAASAADLDGVWEQYIVPKSGWDLVYLCRIELRRSAQGYDATTLDVGPRTIPKQIRTFNHRFDGTTWTFDSDWQDKGIATFQLKRVNDDLFIGWSYLKGEPQSANLWLRRPAR